MGTDTAVFCAVEVSVLPNGLRTFRRQGWGLISLHLPNINLQSEQMNK